MSAVLRVLVIALLGLACGPADPLAEIRESQRQGQFAATVEPLRALVDEDPTWAEANLLLGTALLRTGGAGIAVWPLRRASESAEYAVEAGLRLTEALLESRSGPDAAKAVERVLALEPDNVEALALGVQAHLANARPEDALLDIERVLELDPENLAVLVPRVTTLIATDRIAEAETALAVARERFVASEEQVPPDLKGRLCVAGGLFAFEKGDRESAESQYAECLERFPTDELVVGEAVAFYDRIGEVERATAILEQAREASGNPGFSVGLARRMGALGQPEAEERLLRETAEASPSVGTWFVLADYYVGLDRFDDALAAFEKALAATPNPSSRLRFAYADTLAQAGRYEEARRVARRLRPAELRHLILGRVLLGEGDPRGALTHFEAGIRLWPNNAVGRYLAGQAAERLGDLGRAASEYRESFRAAPGDTEAGLILARIYLERGEPEEALQVLRRYLRSHRGDADAYLLSIRSAEAAGRPELAAEGIATLARLPGQAAVAVAEQARLAGEPQRAAEVVETSGLDLTDPANAIALRALTSHLVAAGEPAQAEARVERALAAHPDEALFHQLRGEVLAAAGRPAQAREAFERALALEPAHAPALVGLAELTAAAGERAAAAALYDRAAEADPAAALAAALLLIEIGEREEAERRLTRILERHPRETRATLALADLVAGRGQLDRAVALAERAAWLRAPGADSALERFRAQRAESAGETQAPE